MRRFEETVEAHRDDFAWAKERLESDRWLLVISDQHETLPHAWNRRTRTASKARYLRALLRRSDDVGAASVDVRLPQIPEHRQNHLDM